MMDCNVTTNFLKEWGRMCRTIGDCDDCPITTEKGFMKHCRDWCRENPEKAIEIVQEWSNAHQPKTRLSVFLEAFPNAAKKKDGVTPVVCTGVIFGFNKEYKGCKNSCADCWNTPIEQGVQ